VTGPGSSDADSYRTQVKTELTSIQEDLLWTEKAHFATAALYGRLHLWLGIVATVTAALAATSVVADWSPVIAGIAAVVSAITSGVVTFLKPQDLEQKHLVAGRHLGALRVDVRQVVDLDLHASRPDEPDDWRVIAREFAQRKAKIDAEAPGTSNRAFRAARRKIDQGHFVHGQP
jgi:hypothetical protein